ncbi:MAG: dipeptide ABC transporter ATP-binding protein [Tissierellaceae bacterium]|nr:dipeptide ABC transporter ATP-binding protein [Tissierellaceae bacterium]
MSNPILVVENLRKYFPIKEGIFNRTKNYVRAVENVSFSVNERETFAIVGESGCGKSTTGRSILRLIEPTSGNVVYNGIDVLALSNKELRGLRKEIQIIFQNPYSSLNPRMTVKKLLSEPLENNYKLGQKEIQEKVESMIDKVGLSRKHLDRYPHQFSGGQRQRISIARSIITNPKLVIADEPVSALDVSIQSQILNLLMELQKELGLTMIFISHDLNVVRRISNRVAVMYLGSIAEIGETEDIFNTPFHPYTEALLSAVPSLDPMVKKKRNILKGEIPSPINPPIGCVFQTRCSKVMDICKKKRPELIEIDKNHKVACHLY